MKTVSTYNISSVSYYTTHFLFQRVTSTIFYYIVHLLTIEVQLPLKSIPKKKKTLSLFPRNNRKGTKSEDSLTLMSVVGGTGRLTEKFSKGKSSGIINMSQPYKFI